MTPRDDRQGPSPSSARVKGRPAVPSPSTGVTHAPEGGPAPDLAGFTVMASAQHHEHGDPIPVVHLCIPRAPGVSTRSPRRWVTITADQAQAIGVALCDASDAAYTQVDAELEHGIADRKQAIADHAAAEAARLAAAYPRLGEPQPEVET